RLQGRGEAMKVGIGAVGLVACWIVGVGVLAGTGPPASMAAGDEGRARGVGERVREGDRVEEEVIPEVSVVEGCQDSLDECKKTLDVCDTKHPLPPGSKAKQFNRVTRYEEGRACEILCYDKNGDPHAYGCEREVKKKTGPKPGDVTL